MPTWALSTSISPNEDTIDKYVKRVGWNPANEPGNWSLLIATPRTIRAWNGVGEITGRTIMRNGDWSAP